MAHPSRGLPHKLRAGAALLVAGLSLTLGACGDDEEPPTTTTEGATGATGANGELGREESLRLAHIDPATGLYRGLEPDARKGKLDPKVLADDGDLAALAEQANCELMLDLPDEGNTHLRPGEDPPDYGTFPPTSGDHDPAPTADGAYLETPEVTQAAHSLEHGRIEVQYSPELSEPDQLALKGLFDAEPEGMLLFPNPDMPFAVAATAWTNLIGCDGYSENALAAIARFRDQFLGKGPERVPF
jgi:hypothetical protein